MNLCFIPAGLFLAERFSSTFFLGRVEAISSKWICADALLTWRETLSSPSTEQRQRTPEKKDNCSTSSVKEQRLLWRAYTHARPITYRITQVLGKQSLSSDVNRNVTNQPLTDAPPTVRDLHYAIASFMRNFHITKLYTPWHMLQAPCKYHGNHSLSLYHCDTTVFLRAISQAAFQKLLSRLPRQRLLYNYVYYAPKKRSGMQLTSFWILVYERSLDLRDCGTKKWGRCKEMEMCWKARSVICPPPKC